jgi:hypothetical protein
VKSSEFVAVVCMMCILLVVSYFRITKFGIVFMNSCMSVIFLSTSKYINRFTVKYSGFLSNVLTLPLHCVPIMVLQM